MTKQELDKLLKKAYLQCPFCGRISPAIPTEMGPPEIDSYDPCWDDKNETTYSADYNWICDGCNIDVVVTIC